MLVYINIHIIKRTWPTCLIKTTSTTATHKARHLRSPPFTRIEKSNNHDYVEFNIDIHTQNNIAINFHSNKENNIKIFHLYWLIRILYVSKNPFRTKWSVSCFFFSSFFCTFVLCTIHDTFFPIHFIYTKWLYLGNSYVYIFPPAIFTSSLPTKPKYTILINNQNYCGKVVYRYTHS